MQVKRKGPDQPYVVLYDEEGRTRRVTVKIMPKKEIEGQRGTMREVSVRWVAIGLASVSYDLHDCILSVFWILDHRAVPVPCHLWTS